jgi:FeS assembly SUF system protein
MSDFLEIQVTPHTGDENKSLDENIVEALRGVYDPEIPVNIYDLGLIYKVDISDTGAVNIEMTLTAPGCPVAETFPGTVEQTVESVDGVTEAHVELVWDPPWTMEKMTEEARLELGLM